MRWINWWYQLSAISCWGLSVLIEALSRAENMSRQFHNNYIVWRIVKQFPRGRNIVGRSVVFWARCQRSWMTVLARGWSDATRCEYTQHERARRNNCRALKMQSYSHEPYGRWGLLSNGEHWWNIRNISLIFFEWNMENMKITYVNSFPRRMKLARVRRDSMKRTI